MYMPIHVPDGVLNKYSLTLTAGHVNDTLDLNI